MSNFIREPENSYEIAYVLSYIRPYYTDLKRNEASKYLSLNRSIELLQWASSKECTRKWINSVVFHVPYIAPEPKLW